MGIYEWALRRIFRYHRASQVLIARSEDLFADVEGVLNEVIAFAHGDEARHGAWTHVHIQTAVHIYANSKQGVRTAEDAQRYRGDAGQLLRAPQRGARAPFGQNFGLVSR